jgi:hypothetical protein
MIVLSALPGGESQVDGALHKRISIDARVERTLPLTRFRSSETDLPGGERCMKTHELRRLLHFDLCCTVMGVAL